MCVAIYKPLGLKLDDTTLNNCFKTNPDGAGFAYIESETGEIRIQKFMEFEPFLAAYKEKQDKYVDSSPFLVHFRIKTHGQKDLENCHPFKIDSRHVFIHNGIIRNVPDCPEKKRSDTRMFKQLFLQQLPEGWFENKAIKELIEEYIGSYSKLAIMNVDGVVNLYNESKGSWKDGVWFSNLLWEPRVYHRHADACLNCGTNIKNNVYANTQNVSFCCLSCKDKYTKGSFSWRDLCEMCNKSSRFSVFRGTTEYHYCSEICRKNHAQILDKATTSKKNESPKLGKGSKASASLKDKFLECCYCGIYHQAYLNIELDVAYGNTKEKEFMCYHCIPDAISAGYISDTPELATALLEIKHEQEERHKKVGKK